MTQTCPDYRLVPILDELGQTVTFQRTKEWNALAIDRYLTQRGLGRDGIEWYPCMILVHTIIAFPTESTP